MAGGLHGRPSAKPQDHPQGTRQNSRKANQVGKRRGSGRPNSSQFFEETQKNGAFPEKGSGHGNIRHGLSASLLRRLSAPPAYTGDMPGLTPYITDPSMPQAAEQPPPGFSPRAQMGPKQVPAPAAKDESVAMLRSMHEKLVEQLQTEQAAHQITQQTLEDCQKELATARSTLGYLQQQHSSLKQSVASKDTALQESNNNVTRMQAVHARNLARIDELRREEAAGDALLAMASEDKAALEKRLAVVTEGKAAVEQRLSMVMEESAASQRAAAAAAQRADDLLQRLDQKDNVLKMEEDKRRAAELRFQADKQAKEAALAAAAEKRIVADMVRDAVARGAVKGADALAAAKEERAVAELVRCTVARGALKAADALAAQDHPAAAATGAIIQLHTQRSSPKDGPQQLHVLDSAASKDNKLTLASIARLAVTWTGNTAAAAASHPLLRPAVGGAGMLMRLPGVSSIMKTSMWTAGYLANKLAHGLVAM